MQLTTAREQTRNSTFIFLYFQLVRAPDILNILKVGKAFQVEFARGCFYTIGVS